MNGSAVRQRSCRVNHVLVACDNQTKLPTPAHRVGFLSFDCNRTVDFRPIPDIIALVREPSTAPAPLLV